MTMQTTHFDDKVTIKCLKNGNMIEAEVLSFRENEFLTAVVQKTAKINMQWNKDKNLYIGIGGKEAINLYHFIGEVYGM